MANDPVAAADVFDDISLNVADALYAVSENTSPLVIRLCECIGSHSWGHHARTGIA